MDLEVLNEVHYGVHTDSESLFCLSNSLSENKLVTLDFVEPLEKVL